MIKHPDKLLKAKLDELYHTYNKKSKINDPIIYSSKYGTDEDVETSAFISSIFSYGNIKQITNVLNNIFSLLDKNPYNHILNLSSKNIADLFANLKHRFYTNNDIILFFWILKSFLIENSSFENFLITKVKSLDSAKNIIESISNEFIRIGNKLNGDQLSRGIKFMFPKPSMNSPSKRMNLFLRWMVRKDNNDFGLWQEIPKSILIIPLDTHIYQVAKKLKMTSLKNPSWKMAEEITSTLKLYCRKDPVKYDFSLCHINIEDKSFFNFI